jgi:hypothetical protein
MKRCIPVILLVVLAIGLAVNAQASLTAGTYDLISSLGNGTWNEILLGAHGVPGNQFLAGGPGWLLLGTLQSVVPASSGSWQYQSTYSINSAMVVPGAWGEAIQISNVAATNLSRRDNQGKLAWELTFTGYDAQNPGIPIVIKAGFDSIGSGAVYYNDNTTLHGGSPFSAITMQVVPIPAAVWLLGSGLLGLVAIRRRFKK